MRRLLTAALLLLVLFAGAPAVAQQEEAKPAETPEARIDELKAALDEGTPVVEAPQATAEANTAKADVAKTESANAKAPETGLLPDLVDPKVLGPEGVESLQRALKAYYDYRIRGFDHRARVFEWQLFSSRLIFGLVTAIVIVGLYFSWLQFMAGLRTQADPAKLSTTLEASPTAGIKVSSPVLGVIILTLSLAFFYLYLVHIYPIAEIF